MKIFIFSGASPVLHGGPVAGDAKRRRFWQGGSLSRSIFRKDHEYHLGFYWNGLKRRIRSKHEMETKMVKRDTAQIKSNWPWIKLLRSCTNTKEVKSSQMVSESLYPLTLVSSFFEVRLWYF
ncbi:hypothetical protein QL285_027319 [Trifolium repens]|nr:hypothetical protein QL285_027319 [Trifolium repens]